MTALDLRTRAQIHAILFENVISNEGHRQVAQIFRAHDLAAQALLKQRKRLQARKILRSRNSLRAQHNEFAIERDAVRQPAAQLLELGIGIRDELLAARPQLPLSAALDILR